jgi:hypothetical protein
MTVYLIAAIVDMVTVIVYLVIAVVEMKRVTMYTLLDKNPSA